MESRRVSELQQARALYRPSLPPALARCFGASGFREGPSSAAPRDAEAIRKLFPKSFGRPAVELGQGNGPRRDGPLRLGVVLSGGQAPGGHNVITGLYDAARKHHAGSVLYGFLGGPRGIFEGDYRELDADSLAAYRNTGGFDLIGGGRDKIETDEQLRACRATCERLALDGLVIVGGDDSNTNAAVLAEHFLADAVKTCVIGVPKTIDGDLKGGGVEASFGFDTATKVYSELIGNICRDAASAGKYWHFIKLMGRHASHVTLECALQCQPNVALIGEEIQERGSGLGEVVESVADVVRRRAEAGRSYGVCLVPEGLVEFVPEIRVLIGQLNELLSQHADYFARIELFSDKQEFVSQKLTRDSSYVFSGLPARIQQQLLLERDSHGNVQVSKIDTEALLVEQVGEKIAEWRAAGEFPGKFQVQGHFFGYEGRSSAPSNFDADYTYGLGWLAAALAAFDRTGYMCALRGLHGPVESWTAQGIPLTSMMQMESRKGRPTPVIAKALVSTSGAPFRSLRDARAQWAIEDHYRFPGPIQYFGPPEVSGRVTRTLSLEGGSA